MKIGIDARILTLPEIRGMADYLISVLKNWPVTTDTFCLYTEEEPRPDRVYCPSTVCWKKVAGPPGNRIHIWDWFALPHALRSEEPDLFWSPANLVFPVRTPQIITVHDTLLQEKVRFSRWFDSFYYRSLIPYIAQRYARHVITVSRFSAGRIHRIFGMPENKIEVIYNGTSFFNKDQAVESKHSDICSDICLDAIQRYKRFIYTLGAESPWKNTRGIIDGFKLLRHTFPDLGLIVSGLQGRAREETAQYCKKENIGNIELLGYVTENDRNTFYRQAEIFVYPSLFEGFGLPVLEAMAFGTPVVASRAASIPEVAGNAAILVDAASPHEIADGITRLLSDKALRDTCKHAAYDNLKRFDWAVSAGRHRDLFLKFLH